MEIKITVSDSDMVKFLKMIESVFGSNIIVQTNSKKEGKNGVSEESVPSMLPLDGLIDELLDDPKNTAEKTEPSPTEQQLRPGQFTMKCAQCGKEFVATHRKTKYCSKKCSMIAQKKKAISRFKKCKTCGEPVKDGKSVYCSAECKKAYVNWSKYSRLKGISFEDYLNGKRPVNEGRPSKTPCKLCLKAYSSGHGHPKFCPECISRNGEEDCEKILASPTQLKNYRNDVLKVSKCQYKVCPKCGMNFHDPHNTKMFCDRCTDALDKKGKKK